MIPAERALHPEMFPAASAATVARPAAALPSAADLYSTGLEQLRGYGTSMQEELRQSYRAALGMGMQSLASAGLAGTTIAPSMRMGYMRQYQQALSSLHDQLARTKVDVMSRLGLGGLQLEQGQRQLELEQQRISNQMELGTKQLALGQRQVGIAENQQVYDWQRGIYAQDLAQKQYELAAQQQKWNQRAYEQSRADAQAYLQMV